MKNNRFAVAGLVVGLALSASPLSAQFFQE